MVQDNPFTEPPPAPAETSAGLADSPHSLDTPPSHHAASESPPSRPVLVRTPAYDTPPSPAGHPGIQAQPGHSALRAPRRVQWTSDHVINIGPEHKAEINEHEHEHGHEHEHAHARHAPDLAHVNRALEGFGRDSHGDEDYDYRLDPDPGDIEGEEAANVPSDDVETFRRLLEPESVEHVAGHIQLGETDGLPTYRPDEDTKTASDLVHRHTGKWGSLRRRVRSGSVVRKGGGAGSGEKEAVNEKEENSGKALAPITETVEGTGDKARISANPPLNPPQQQAGMPHLPAGTSVLSSLLALYNTRHQGLDSGPNSSATTPQSSRPPSPDEERGRSKKKKARSKSPWRRSTSSTPARGDKGDGDWTPPPRIDTPDFNHGSRNKSASSLINQVQRAVHDFRDERPRQARSGAGVFGALVANTATMAAPAAPSSSTLVPSSTKPGYHLTRYSLNTSPPVTPPAGQGRFNFSVSGGSRPGSRAGSRPTSRVGSWANLQAFRDGRDSVSPSASRNSWLGEEDRAKSSDNLIEMKGKKERKAKPRPLILGGKTEKTLTPEQAEDERRRKEWEAEKKRRKKAKEARKKQEVYIIQHVAAILSRQQFILKLARALMMFGSPTHRIETQIQATARVLDISAQVVYLPNLMLVSFADDTTHTSETKFLKQSAGLDLGKLRMTHELYWEVVHDRMSVDDASRELDHLMTMPPCYNWWQMILIAGFCSGIIVITSYYGSFLDALMAAPLGMLLQAVQLIAFKNDLFNGVFEIVIATVISFLAAVLASTHYFCYTALVSGGIVLILPGFIVLSGALELASRNITAGAVRMGYSVIYALFLGFGISIGSEIYVKIRGEAVTNATNNTCTATRYDGAPWYQSKPSSYWYFLTVPAFSFFLSLNLQQPLRGRTGVKELPIMMSFACAGWVTNFFAGRAFSGRSDIVSAVGSFCVGMLGNLYGRFSNGSSFPVMVTGILMQLPSGLKEGGLFNFANDTSGNTVTQYSTGFRVAGQLVSVAIGLTVGLFVAAVLTHPLGGSKRRGAAIFSF